MINHSNCDHESSRAARAKCRRGATQGDAPKRKVMGREKREAGDTDSYGQTPRDRDKQCDNCGVEKIAYRGTDPLTGILKFVGEKCEYIVRRSEDRLELE